MTQSVLVEGEIRARVYQPDGEPPLGFQPVPASLEDAYLITMMEAGEVELLAPPELAGAAVEPAAGARAAGEAGR